MRVLLVVDDLDIGGAQRQVVGLARALAERGNTVALACTTGGNTAAAASLKESGVRVEVLGHRHVTKRFSPGFAARIARLARTGRFDVLHGHVHAAAMAAAAAGPAAGVPVVVTEHSMASWRGSVARGYSRPLYRRCATVLAVSDEIARRLRTVDRVPPGRVMVLGTALFPDSRDPVPGYPPGGGFGGLLSPRQGVRVGVVARLQPEKGIDVFLHAVARVAPDHPDARFTVVGDGDLRAPLTALAARLGLAEHVRFVGACCRGEAAVAAFDVLCVPSLTEGAPLVVLEALTAGVPVVASTVGAIPEQVEDAGVLVPPGDPAALAEALRRLLDDAGERFQLGTAALKRAASLPTAADVTDAVEEVYRRVVGG